MTDPRGLWIALSNRHSVILALTSGFSKTVSLGRDTAIIWTLGFSTGADRVQIGLATAGLVGGIGGSALGQTFLPTFLAKPLSDRVYLTRGLTFIISVFLTCAVLFSALGAAMSALGSAIIFGLMLGSIQAVSSLAVLMLQGVEDVSFSASTASLDGLVTCAVLGSLRFLGSVSYETVVLIILADAAAVSIALVVRLSWLARHSEAAPPLVVARILWAPATRRRFASLGLSFGSVSFASVALRVVAARQPGGAALLALAQRFGGIIAGLITQPFQSLAYLALGRGERTGVERVGREFLQALLVVTTLAGALIAAVVALFPRSAELASGHRVSSVAVTVVLVVLAVNCSNASTLAVRDWLVRSEFVSVVRSYLVYLVVVIVVLAIPGASGASLAAGVELLALAVQVGIAQRFSVVLRATLIGPTRLALALLLAASLPTLVLWREGQGLWAVSLALSALGVGTLWGGRRRAIRWLLSALWPSDHSLGWRSEV